MEKRYQVFVSSTYADLKEERQKVIQTLMEMDCIPAGMELFPAADEEQWEFIKKVIDDCDYYLLIIGGRYGSTTPEGISYTEKEYDYAVESGLKVIALLHESPDELSVKKSDIKSELRAKLEAFREKVRNGRIVKFWKDATDLPGQVALSLSKTIKTYPAVGWVRTNAVASEELLSELNESRKEINQLKDKIFKIESTPPTKVNGLADLDEKLTISGTYKYYKYSQQNWSVDVTWKELFAAISPYIQEHPSSGSVKISIRDFAMEKAGVGGDINDMDDQIFQTISIQFKALGLVNIRYSQSTKGTMHLFWSLTPQGERLMMETRIVRKSN